jgi:hypothetical protein
MPELRKLNRAFRPLSCEMTLERRISDISSINELGRTRLHEKTKVLYLPACPIACGKVPKIALDWKSAPPLVRVKDPLRVLAVYCIFFLPVVTRLVDM